MPAFRVRTEKKWVWVTLVWRDGVGPWYYRCSVNNTDYFRSTGCTDEREARKEATQLVHGLDQRCGAKLPLPDLIKAYLQARWPQFSREDAPATSKNRTYETARSKLAMFQAWAGKMPQAHQARKLAALTERTATQVFQTYIDYRRTVCENNTVDGDARALSRFCTHLIKRRVAAWEHNPASKLLLEVPTKDPVEHQDVTDADLAELLKRAKGTPVWPVVLLCLGAGLRPGGACRTGSKNLSLGEWPAVKVIEKGKERTVPLPAWVADELRAWKPVYPGRGDPHKLWHRSEGSAHNYIQKLREIDPPLGDHITLQALRRVHSTLCYDMGMLPQDEARRLGHSVVVAEKSYVQWKSLKQRQVLDHMDARLQKLAANPEQNPEQGDNAKEAKSKSS